MDKKICEMVTGRLIAEMEKGIIPWSRQWTGSAQFVSHSTGRPYSFVNQILLSICKAPGEFITFSQAIAEGGKIKKGSKGCPVVFWKQRVVTDTDPETGEEKQRIIPVLKYYTVFSVTEDCEGIEVKHDPAQIVHADTDESAEKIVTEYQARENINIIRNKTSDKAYYSPSRDIIQMPTLEQFPKTSEYYSTLFHEMTHSTGHASRLNRFTGSAKNAAFASEEYSKEELIAEIGAAALVNRCGLETGASFRNSAAYLQSWIRALKDDPTMIISAAGKAEKATAYILGE